MQWLTDCTPSSYFHSLKELCCQTILDLVNKVSIILVININRMCWLKGESIFFHIVLKIIDGNMEDTFQLLLLQEGILALRLAFADVMVILQFVMRQMIMAFSSSLLDEALWHWKVVKTLWYKDCAPAWTAFCNLDECSLMDFFPDCNLDSDWYGCEGCWMAVPDKESLSSDEDKPEKWLQLDLDLSLSDEEDSSSDEDKLSEKDFKLFLIGRISPRAWTFTLSINFPQIWLWRMSPKNHYELRIHHYQYCLLKPHQSHHYSSYHPCEPLQSQQYTLIYHFQKLSRDLNMIYS